MELNELIGLAVREIKKSRAVYEEKKKLFSSIHYR
jgi:hypothetical protein